ncbi:E3 ubiquitin-protein ligase RNF12-B-like isoform X2 [Xyrauchen texanus]|uniref:E3 ubiquitin-protein ligase RNF12-B-like isoform X2 n=1 Tax=Xyrauchen texanus TaxID=154827 RepID=UPI0022424AD9|nr:E3 ubiquitin-protein ligase RNF12-B-like isoform X2 [Xyrauchen texanus]
MPSKRKKNKRRMRRVQAQRRTLEEQYASSGKGTPGVQGVSAPVLTRVPVPKMSACPIAVPINTPVAVVSPVDVPAEIPPEESVKLEVQVTDAIKDKVVMVAEDLTEAPVEPPIEEPAVIEEPESVTIPLTEVTTSVDEPVSIPAQSEITAPQDKPVSIPAESESVHGAPEPEEVAVDVHPKPEAEMVPVETAVPTEALVKPEPEQQSATMKEPTPSGCNMIKPVVESTSDPFAEDCVVTESAIGVEAAIAEEKIPEITTDAPEVLSETLEETNPAPEPVPLPKEIIHAQDEFMAQVETEIKKAQDEFMSQVETEVKKDLAMSGGLTVDTINGCLATTEVAIEG